MRRGRGKQVFGERVHRAPPTTNDDGVKINARKESKERITVT